METPLLFLGSEYGNQLYVKRDDLYPLAFGGNKARIARRYFEEIDAGGYDCVVTYGSSRSNLCCAVAAMAAARGMTCVTVMHGGGESIQFNNRLVRLSGAQQVYSPVSSVSAAIDATLDRLRQEGRRPCFIPGGGQGAAGIRAYVECYEEIKAYERSAGIPFDFIFLPSGTGTTQAGLVCGKLLCGGDCEIVGISVARTADRGRPEIIRNVLEYCSTTGLAVSEDVIERSVIFEDAYTAGGYAKGDYLDTIVSVWKKYAIPLDNTYTAKAFCGMQSYLTVRGIVGKRILFLHTGGIPLFFDDLPCGING